MAVVKLQLPVPFVFFLCYTKDKRNRKEGYLRDKTDLDGPQPAATVIRFSCSGDRFISAVYGYKPFLSAMDCAVSADRPPKQVLFIDPARCYDDSFSILDLSDS